MSYPGQEFAVQYNRARHRRRRARDGESENIRRRLATMAKRTAGVCIRCGGPSSGLVECNGCRVYTATYQRSRYHARREAGLCTHCGQPSEAGSLCRKHADRKNLRRKLFGRGPGG